MLCAKGGKAILTTAYSECSSSGGHRVAVPWQRPRCIKLEGFHRKTAHSLELLIQTQTFFELRASLSRAKVTTHWVPGPMPVRHASRADLDEVEDFHPDFKLWNWAALCGRGRAVVRWRAIPRSHSAGDDGSRLLLFALTTACWASRQLG